MHSMLSPQPSSPTIAPLALVVVALEPSVIVLIRLPVFIVVVAWVMRGAIWGWGCVLVVRTMQADRQTPQPLGLLPYNSTSRSSPHHVGRFISRCRCCMNVGIERGLVSRSLELSFVSTCSTRS